ncbi:hypothetical protein ACFQ5F_16640 [Kroppenstedtia eburnea]|uniref:hypothetical protein n=1 Tax=Kroppenstedtia eburnea TaxID=714067 RepID=UPI00020C86BA|nr:hypothetical protein HMPREF9374_0582 [Desmospora sp. 8437]
MSTARRNPKGLQAKSSPEQYVNQRWRRCWVTRRHDGETFAMVAYPVGKHEKGIDLGLAL